MTIVRFFRGALLLGVAEAEENEPLVEVAEKAGVDIPHKLYFGQLRHMFGSIEGRKDRVS